MSNRERKKRPTKQKKEKCKIFFFNCLYFYPILYEVFKECKSKPKVTKE